MGPTVLISISLAFFAKVGEACIEEGRVRFSSAKPISTMYSSLYSGAGDRGVPGPSEEIVVMLVFPSKLILRPSMLESVSLSISLMNLARVLKLVKLSESETSEASSSIVPMSVCLLDVRACQMSCDRRVDFGISSASEVASIEVAVERGLMADLLAIDNNLAAI